MGDREDVLDEVDRLFPFATKFGDQFLNYHALREIMLGGSPPWAGFHQRFSDYADKKIMDIGANEGVFTLFAALKGAQTVNAYEPSPMLYERMMKLLFYIPSINPLNFALWKERGVLSFLGHATQDPDALRTNGSLESEGIRWTGIERASAPQVACVTLADALGDDEWDAVKMDIEGAEAEVILSTDPETFQKIKFMFIEFHPWVSDETYGKMLERLEQSFRIECAWMGPKRMESAYLWRK